MDPCRGLPQIVRVNRTKGDEGGPFQATRGNLTEAKTSVPRLPSNLRVYIIADMD